MWLGSHDAARIAPLPHSTKLTSFGRLPSLAIPAGSKAEGTDTAASHRRTNASLVP